MSQVDYAVMSDVELRQYFLRHREDKEALQAYLDRLGDPCGICEAARPRQVITTVDDPDFDAKIQAAILRKMQAAGSSETEL
ncbi:MAG: hypothetical protein KME11_13825 [Timaviella obliquedivisa GSE-PSE-MK23-08B]|jgi:hypothetical protein|nr:hypothetical protein [Timaviella obliquedivisa GSE-PSE-MK23-08B]